MNTRTLIIVAASILAACSSSNRTITLTIDQEKLKNTSAAKLATQLENIKYPATVTHEGDTVNIRVGAASIPDVRRAMCRQMGWPSAEGKMVRMADTLAFLMLAGITKVKSVGGFHWRGDGEVAANRTLSLQLHKSYELSEIKNNNEFLYQAVRANVDEGTLSLANVIIGCKSREIPNVTRHPFSHRVTLSRPSLPSMLASFHFSCETKRLAEGERLAPHLQLQVFT